MKIPGLNETSTLLMDVSEIWRSKQDEFATGSLDQKNG